MPPENDALEAITEPDIRYTLRLIDPDNPGGEWHPVDNEYEEEIDFVTLPEILELYRTESERYEEEFEDEDTRLQIVIVERKITYFKPKSVDEKR